MDRIAFFTALCQKLSPLPEAQLSEILRDFEEYFNEGIAEGRSEEALTEALGDPDRLARELRAEHELQRWKRHHGFRNMAAVLGTLGSLLAIDVIFLFPSLTFSVVVFILSSIALLATGIVGTTIAVSALLTASGIHWSDLFFGLSILSGDAAATLLFCSLLKFIVARLGEYALFHIRLVRQRRGKPSFERTSLSWGE